MLQTVIIYEWVGEGNGDSGNNNSLRLVTEDIGSIAYNNDLERDVPNGWPYVDGGTKYLKNAFYEGSIDLSRVTSDICFSSFLLEGRSSQSLTASLDDFVAGTFTGKPATPVGFGDGVCPPGGIVHLTATAAAGTTLKWYDNAAFPEPP